MGLKLNEVSKTGPEKWGHGWPIIVDDLLFDIPKNNNVSVMLLPICWSNGLPQGALLITEIT